MAIGSLGVTGIESIVASLENANVALPTTGSPTTCLVTNLGVAVAYVLLGNNTVTVSSSTGVAVLPGSSVALALGENTYLAAFANQSVPLNIVLGD
jgi:hypothetical protein